MKRISDLAPAALMLVAIVLIAPQHAWARADSQIRSLINASGLRDTQVSVMAVDMDTGEVIASIDADEPRIPASNMKLVTTAAALRVLGPDYLFQTDLTLIGNSPKGGTLLVRGDGDPGFGDPKLLEMHSYDVDMLVDVWVQAVIDAGVKQVDQLIIDDRVFDQEFVHEDWPHDQLNQWYCAQVAGINFHDNCLDLYPAPTYKGHGPKVTARPHAPFLEILNRAVTGTADTFWVSRKFGSNDLTYRGKVKTERSKPVSVTLHDPPRFFAQLLAFRLKRKNVGVKLIVRPGPNDDLPEGKVLHRIQTALPLILARCNKDSQNLFAESLLKRMGHQITGSPGSWNNGAAALRKFLHERLGARGATITIADGSGMSRANLVTARLIVELLGSMHRDTELGRLYRDSLSRGGEDGTLRRRFTNGMRGQVYGKSGFINEVSALSGYLIFSDDEDKTDAVPTRTIAFSMLFNGFKPPIYNHKIKQVQNSIVQLLDKVAAPAEKVNLGG